MGRTHYIDCASEPEFVTEMQVECLSTSVGLCMSVSGWPIFACASLFGFCRRCLLSLSVSLSLSPSLSLSLSRSLCHQLAPPLFCSTVKLAQLDHLCYALQRKYQERAKEAGVCILQCSGLSCLPADLATLFTLAH